MSTFDAVVAGSLAQEPRSSNHSKAGWIENAGRRTENRDGGSKITDELLVEGFVMGGWAGLALLCCTSWSEMLPALHPKKLVIGAFLACVCHIVIILQK